MNAFIRRGSIDEADWLHRGYSQMGSKPAGYFAHVLAQQEAGELVLLVAVADGTYLGHAKVVWLPDYPLFRAEGIPEIQDLNVVPAYRRRGIGSRLLDAGEELIATRSPLAGIGVGLYADYGAAQRLYVRRGYLPDGRGVYYANEPVTPGASVPVDDDLVLHFTRRL